MPRPKNSPSKLWSKLKPLARQMRHKPTLAENTLWQAVRRKALGINFRRQHAIDRFIVDFYAPAVNLVVEVDGSIHEYTEEEDAIRQLFLEEVYGLTFLRFSNGNVIKHTEAVLESIAEKIAELQTPP